MPEIRLEDVSKSYKVGSERFLAVRDINLNISQGEFVFLLGSSGAGKSTLLQLIAGELQPDCGTIWIGENNMTRQPYWRRYECKRAVGQVWQDVRLVRKKSIHANLAIALQAVGADKRQMARDIPKALGIVGMSGVDEKFPVELSTGEAKRVELARAILNNPPILVMDEPTANLDPDSAQQVIALLGRVAQEGTGVLVSTHDMDFVPAASHCYHMEQGCLI